MIAIHQKLAAIFQGEHAEHLEHIRSILALLENAGETKGRTEIDEAFRHAHTLKGAARAVDLAAVEGLASGLETLFSRVREGTLPLDQRMTRVIHQVLDASEDCVGAFRDDRIPEEPAAALRAMQDLLENRETRIAGPVDLPAKPAVTATAPQASTPPVEMVRLPAENLDRLVRSTSQILTESLRQASVTGELDALDSQIAEMEAECIGFRKASAASSWRLASQPEYSLVIRHIGFVEQKVRALAAQSRTACRSQRRTAWNSLRSVEQLQRDVWSARMAPAEDLFEGFR